MSHPTTDPLETLVADGRIKFRPATQFGTVTVIDLDIDLGQLRNFLYEWLAPILSDHQPLRNLYRGNRYPSSTTYEVIQQIRFDVKCLIHVAVGICYNRLRNILEIWNPAYTSRKNDYEPVSVNNKTEMPTFLASLFGSIGPFRLRDGGVDKIIVYVPTVTNLNIDSYRQNAERLVEAMKRCGIGLSTIDINNVTEVGSAFTTIRHIVDADKWDTYGTVHQSYDNDDLVRSYLFASSAVGSVPVVKPAVGTANNREKKQSGACIVNCGDNPMFLSILANGVCVSEIKSKINYRMVAS